MALSAAMVLSGLQREHFSEDTQHVFNVGVTLLKAPPSTPPLKPTDTTSTTDSGASGSSFAKGLRIILDVISQLEEKILFVRGKFFGSRVEKIESKSVSIEVKESSDVKVEREIQIMYENRDILNLAENIRTGWSFQYSIVTCEPSDHFEDRSEIHRIKEKLEVPRYLLATCDDCSFLEPKFF